MVRGRVVKFIERRELCSIFIPSHKSGAFALSGS